MRTGIRFPLASTLTGDNNMKNSAPVSLNKLPSLAFVGAFVACLVVMGFLSPAQAARAALPKITSSLSTTGTVQVPFDYQITASHSPASYGATNLPAGLGIDSSTGEITGSPQSTGTSTATISATNASGTGSANLTIKIAASAVPVITSSLEASGTTGTA